MVRAAAAAVREDQPGQPAWARWEGLQPGDISMGAVAAEFLKTDEGGEDEALA